jgi:hypothetical protein
MVPVIMKLLSMVVLGHHCMLRPMHLSVTVVMSIIHSSKALLNPLLTLQFFSYLQDPNMNTQIEKLIDSTVEILDRDPLSQSEDTYSILLKFTQAIATELGEIVVQDPVKDGVRMYFDEKIARYVIKKSVGL